MTTTHTTTDQPTVEDYRQTSFPITTVRADEVRVGDFVIESEVMGRVTGVTPNLGLGWIDHDERLQSGHAWHVAKFDVSGYGGVVAFPYAPVRVIRREDWRAHGGGGCYGRG